MSVVGRAAAAVEQPGPAERVGPGADAHDGAAVGVVTREPSERAGGHDAGARDPGRAPAGHDDEVVGGQRRPLSRRADGQRPARCGRLPARPRSAARTPAPRSAAVLNAWAGPARSSRCRPGTSRKTTLVTIWSTRPDSPITSSTVAMVAKRPASAYSVRSMTALAGSVRGSASSSSTDCPAGASRCGIGLVAVASVTNATSIAEVGRHPGGRLAALLGPDAADDQLGDSALRSAAAAGRSW